MPRRWHQVGGIIFAGDGGKKARSPGRARISRKPLRGECRMFSGVTVVTNARVYYSTRAAAGAPSVRYSPRPLYAGPKDFQNLGRIAPREGEDVSRKEPCRFVR